MDWREEYKRKLASPEEAVSLVQSGDTVAIPLGGDPEALCTALARRKNHLKNVTVWAGGIRRDYGFWAEDARAAFKVIGDQTIGILREPLRQRLADYGPTYYCLRFKPQDERPAEADKIDVTLVLVSSPDRNGYCSFGHFMCNKKSYALRSRTVLAQVDDRLIRTYGDNFIHVSQIARFVEQRLPNLPWGIPQGEQGGLGRRPASAEAKAIAEYVKPLIKDGDCIQLGPGSTSQYLFDLGAFEGRGDLGCLTAAGMAGQTRSVLEGQTNGKRKNLFTGKAVSTTFSIDGDPNNMYQLDMNPKFELYSQEYVNDIRLIMQHDNMVAINNAITVDLTGQIASDGLGYEIWSGAGGQAEFAIGSVLSRGGKSITVLPSVAAAPNGIRLSRIVPLFPEGTPVTILRTFADYIITEYGVAKLMGKSYKQRAAELIAVAHPDFRGELKKDAERVLGTL